jgi:competence protein ComEA
MLRDPSDLSHPSLPGTAGQRPPDDPVPMLSDDAAPRPDGVGSATEGRAPAREPLVAYGAAGRLVRRWLPAGVARWRLDPGRPAALVLAAVVLLGAVLAGVAVWRTRPVAEPVPALAAAVSGTPETNRADSTELVVSVAGLVVHPGLVRLAPGSRVADAVEAAGGPVPGTDLIGVNLARRLTDGEHVVVGPAAPAQTGDTPSGSGGRVDLNTATLADLDALPGIGPVTAQRILDWRSVHGRFASVDQLREVDGIGEARFAQLRELVTA